MTMMKRSELLFLVALSAVGCGGPVEPQRDTEEPSMQAADQEPEFEDVGDPNDTFTQTQISVKEDGAVETQSATVTRAQQWEMRRRVRAEAAKDFREKSDLNPQFQWTKIGPSIPNGLCETTATILILWDDYYYVGNQVCFQFQANWYYDAITGQTLPLFSPGSNMSDFYRGTPTNCGSHTWFEQDRSCLFINGVFQWKNDYTNALSYLRARSVKNNTDGDAIFSTSASRWAGSNLTVGAHTQTASLSGGGRRYLKALP